MSANDAVIRDLVEAIGAWPGIKVLHSCAGDIPKLGDFYEGYVIVEAETLVALSSLISVLPLDVHYARNELSVADEWINGSFSMRPNSGENEVMFCFWFAGAPKERQGSLMTRSASAISACLRSASKI